MYSDEEVIKNLKPKRKFNFNDRKIFISAVVVDGTLS